MDYQASSPDEKALVEGCACIGFLYTGEVNEVLTVKLQPFKGAYMRKLVTDTSLHFDRLATLEFTSDRKRMSTIVRDGKGQIWLLTKGAESYVLPLCQATSRSMIAVTQAHIDDYARIGLRTLAVARRKMSEDEFLKYQNGSVINNIYILFEKLNMENVHTEINEAGNSLTNRSALMADLQAKLEQSLSKCDLVTRNYILNVFVCRYRPRTARSHCCRGCTAR